MRLMTHNFLLCNVAVRNRVDFSTVEMRLEEREDDFNREFILKLIKKIDWAAFRSGAADIGYTIPETLPSDLNDEVLKNIHHALLELEVMSGKLVCRHCGREYVIEQGIPNMLLREDEV
ncbi:uncharacterized protein [Blastocystis hominis]|uniref:Trm112p-like protein n=1 Tax=Blastocystis hominis TaxID=12968 RepID=D8M6P4_BLAHO|nr:uncharacterized protein [Blastocystis hominis]CBK23462.2 unnamed protein product [Blastocystis hominis]|eukprot:XP_012897510.1 uncharacterized protein [Blastocystis hominis]